MFVQVHYLNSEFKEEKKESFNRTPAPLPKKKAVKNNSKVSVNLDIIRCNILTVHTLQANMH